jgi:hypothetical protein
MLKKIALLAVLFAVPAFSTVASAGQPASAPTKPQPKGWCYPAGMPCATVASATAPKSATKPTPSSTKPQPKGWCFPAGMPC